MENWGKSELKFRYMMLDLLKRDCEYYLGNGGRSANILWAGDEAKQIKAMKDIWNSFRDWEKPEWLTWEDILEFEREMVK